MTTDCSDSTHGWRERARRLAKIAFLCGALFLGAIGAILPLTGGQTAQAAGGKPGVHFSGGINNDLRGSGGIKSGIAQPAIAFSASCPPLSADPDPRRYLVSRVYYVNHAPAVNVRSGPGLGYCVIATQSYTANVVAVPGVATVYNDGYRWRQVAFYLGQPRTANNYSWSAVGWIADSLLTRSTNGMQCVEAGCSFFHATNAGWGILGPFPNEWDDYGCAYACRYGPTWPLSACYNYGSPPTNDSCSTLGPGAGFGIGSASPGQGAATVDPNWFVIYSRVSGCSDCTRLYLFWNYSFWAN